ncbi:MAG: cyclic nucleotide-binding domain-containing protein [Gammaproteobacteria bacterium]|nr:cyclic nucleotide-binding domain-containing protein [Gammaproteobacteria bacterium]
MVEEKQYEILHNSPLGHELSEDECRTLLKVMHLRRLKDGEVFIEQGAKDNALHLLASGQLMVTKTAAGGDSIKLHTMKPGELAGAMGFVDGIPRSVALHAVGDAVVYSLEREAFEPLVEQHPRLVYHIMRAVTRTAHTALLGVNNQVEELTNYIIRQHGRY